MRLVWLSLAVKITNVHDQCSVGSFRQGLVDLH